MLRAGGVHVHEPPGNAAEIWSGLDSACPGGGFPSQQIAAARGLHECAQLISGVTPKRFVPLPRPQRIQFYNPIIEIAVVGRRLGAEHPGLRGAADDIPTVCGLLNRDQVVPAVATMSFLPLLDAIRVRFDDPIVACSVCGSGFIARRAGIGGATQYKPAIGGLLCRTEQINVVTTVGFLPEFVSLGVNSHNPEISRAKSRACLVSRNTAVGCSTKQISAVPGCHDGVQHIVTIPPKVFFPLLHSRVVNFDHPIIILSVVRSRLVPADR